MANLLFNLYVLESRGAEFYAFLLEAIFKYFILFVPQFGLK